MTDRLDLALKRAVAAVSLDDSAEARAGLRSVLARTPQLAAYFPGEWGVPEPSPDGTQVAVLGVDDRVRFLDAGTGEELGTYDPSPPGWRGRGVCICEPMAWSPAGDRVAVGVLNGIGPPVRLVDPTTYDETPVPLGGLAQNGTVVSDLEFSADGRFLAATVDGPYTGASIDGSSGHAYVWDLRAPSTPGHASDSTVPSRR